MPTTPPPSLLQGPPGNAWLGLLLLLAALALLGTLVLCWRQRQQLRTLRGHALKGADEREATQQQWHERERLYHSLLAGIPGAAYRCTPDATWRVIFVSDMVRELTGWAPADYLASPTLLQELVHVDERARVMAEIDEACARGQRFTLEYQAVRRDGSLFWAWEQGCAVRDASGQVVWLDGVILDISERKAMEMALREAKLRAEQASNAKMAFLTNMGHEVRTPLNAITGFSEVLLRSDLDAMQRQYVVKVRHAAHALLRLITDILDMARLERGGLSLEEQQFSLVDLAHEVLEAHRSGAERKGLALELQIDPALVEHVFGDMQRLRQVVEKLLDNAVKFTERGSVRLQLTQEAGHELLLAVHDTGIGIAPERQAQIFETFTQGDGSASRRYEGTGLGTALAQRLVKRMGGSLQLQSTPGVGSVFSVRLPLAPAAVPRSVPAGAATAQRAPAPSSTAVDTAQEAPSPPQWSITLGQAIDALRNGEHVDEDMPALLRYLRNKGLGQQASQIEQALALFDLDRAAEVLETLPSSL